MLREERDGQSKKAQNSFKDAGVEPEGNSTLNPKQERGPSGNGQ